MSVPDPIINSNLFIYSMLCLWVALGDYGFLLGYPALGAGSRRFESCRPDQFLSMTNGNLLQGNLPRVRITEGRPDAQSVEFLKSRTSLAAKQETRTIEHG